MKNQSSKRHPPDDAPIDPGLTSAQFHILLTLAEGRRHGYGIMQEIFRRTDGTLELGPGTLYRSIKQLLERGLITEVEDASGEESRQEKRRRPYALTPAGKARTAEEARRLRELVQWAEDTMVLEGGQP
jgi:DNA-binding PadR family transcriptional regulator